MTEDEKKDKDEQTNKVDTQGEADSKALAADGKPLSDYDKALALVIRREKATEAEREVLEEKKKLAANEMIGGTAGGHIEVKKLSDEEIASNKRVQMIGEMTGAEWAKSVPKPKQ